MPSVLMHGVFNGVTLYSLFARGPASAETETPLPLSVAIGGSVLTLVLLGLVYLLGDRSAWAGEARRKDEA
jgi:hypothetical protein